MRVSSEESSLGDFAAVSMNDLRETEFPVLRREEGHDCRHSI